VKHSLKLLKKHNFLSLRFVYILPLRLHTTKNKGVESFNNVIASKAPKRIHYSGSGSLENRVSCAVAEKNMGTQYVRKINT